MARGGKREGAGGGKARPRAGAERVPDPSPHGGSREGQRLKKSRSRLPLIGKSARRKKSAASHPALNAKFLDAQAHRRRGRPASYRLPTLAALKRMTKPDLFGAASKMRERLRRHATEAANYRAKYLVIKQAHRDQGKELAKAKHVAEQYGDSPVDDKVGKLLNSVNIALGVSANYMPFFSATSGLTHANRIDPKKVLAPNTYLNDLRIVAEAIRQKTLSGLRDVPIYALIDLATRSEHLAAMYITYHEVDPDVARIVPVKHMLGISPAHGESAPAVMDLLLARLGPNLARHLAGCATDGPNVMVGRKNGLGVRLAKKLRRHLRLEICGKHGFALMLATPLEIAFGGAQRNEMTVLQMIYIAWYICNGAWAAVESLMHDEIDSLSDADFRDLKRRLGPEHQTASRQKVKKQLKKCVQPAAFRWGTIGAAYKWLRTWSTVFYATCKKIYEWSSKSSSVALALDFCSMWDNSLLRAQFEFAYLYVLQWAGWWDDFCGETKYGHPSDFGAFFSWERYRDRKEDLDRMEDELKESPEYDSLVKAWRKRDASKCVKTIVEEAQAVHEKYFGHARHGVFALGALGSGSSATRDVVCAVLIALGRRSELPDGYATEDGELLAQTIFHDPETVGRRGLVHSEDYVREVVARDGFLDGMLGLLFFFFFFLSLFLILSSHVFFSTALLRAYDECDDDEFQDFLFSPESPNVCVQWLQAEVLPCPVHTQMVESTFAAVDFVMKAHNLGGKLKNSHSRGAIQSPDLLQALLLIRDEVLKKRSSKMTSSLSPSFLTLFSFRTDQGILQFVD